MRAFIVGLILSAPGLLIACTTVRGPLDIPRQADAAAARANALGIAHYKLGEDEMGHWIVAKGYFEDAIKADPMLAEPHYNLALTLDKLGEHTEATIHSRGLENWRSGIPRSLVPSPIAVMSPSHRMLAAELAIDLRRRARNRWQYPFSLLTSTRVAPGGAEAKSPGTPAVSR